MNHTSNMAVYGGTFDPIHNGHVEVITGVYTHTHYNHIVCVPNAQNPQKNYHPTASGHDRLNMLHLALQDITYASLIDYEIKKDTPSYTIDTLLYLRSFYHIENKIGLIVGSDILIGLSEWENIDYLTSLVELLVIPRPGYDIDTIINKDIDENIVSKYNPYILKEISTEDIQAHCLRSDIYSHKSDIPDRVWAYIVEHELYGTNNNHV